MGVRAAAEADEVERWGLNFLIAEFFRGQIYCFGKRRSS